MGRSKLASNRATTFRAYPSVHRPARHIGSTGVPLAVQRMGVQQGLVAFNDRFARSLVRVSAAAWTLLGPPSRSAY